MYDDFGNEVMVTTMSDTLTLIGKAEQDPDIYGTMLFVDSGGGSAVAGEFIAAELKKSAMPSVAYIFDTGASAAYLAATGADTIITSPFADVGSIGVTMSYLDYSRQNREQGIDYVSLASAKFKDYGSPDKPLTTEERTLLERDLAIWHEEFVKQVATNRNLPIEDVAKLADGSSVPAKIALENKLIDQIGDKETARAWFAEQLEMPVENVVFCQ
jgi:protease-4